MFRPDRIGLAGCFVVFILAFAFHDLGGIQGGKYQKREKIQRRPPLSAPVEQRRPPTNIPGPALPRISSNDPTLKLAPSVKGNSTGTAFSIGPGIWMTARHVLEGCRKVGIQVGRKRVARGYNIVLNPFHDLALFKTKETGASFRFDREELRLGQNAFHFGFPQGKPAALHSTLLGRANINPGRKTRHKEPVLAWAEIRRVPNFSGSLGGISGGPVVDRDGDIIGVSVVEARRRGRIFTAAPIGLLDMLERGKFPQKTNGNSNITEKIDPQYFAKIGRELRERLSVSKVLCWAD